MKLNNIKVLVYQNNLDVSCIHFILVLSGPAGPFCVWGIFRPLYNLYQVYVKKKLEKQNWWSITETSYAATNFQPIHLRNFP